MHIFPRSDTPDTPKIAIPFLTILVQMCGKQWDLSKFCWCPFREPWVSEIACVRLPWVCETHALSSPFSSFLDRLKPPIGPSFENMAMFGPKWWYQSADYLTYWLTLSRTKQLCKRDSGSRMQTFLLAIHLQTQRYIISSPYIILNTSKNNGFVMFRVEFIHIWDHARGVSYCGDGDGISLVILPCGPEHVLESESVSWGKWLMDVNGCKPSPVWPWIFHIGGLLVVWNMTFMTFHSVGNVFSSQLTNSIIFQRGRYTTNQ